LSQVRSRIFEGFDIPSLSINFTFDSHLCMGNIPLSKISVASCQRMCFLLTLQRSSSNSAGCWSRWYCMVSPNMNGLASTPNGTLVNRRCSSFLNAVCCRSNFHAPLFPLPNHHRS
jgi:hypothetical protein